LALKHILRSAQSLNKPVSICGEMAGDPMSALLLVGMGYKQLSMSPKSLPKLRWILRHFDFSDAQSLLDQVLSCSDLQRIQHIMKQAFREVGLARLVGEEEGVALE
jgi:phosphotransferase system, enzyme I, PtsP